MCGIAGFIHNKADKTADYLYKLAKNMGDAMMYRGPDSWGTWHDETLGVGLVHRRLAIVDLSDTGKQPMLSHSGRYVMVYNGEIYNHQALRKTLQQKNVTFNGTSDSEVILEYIAHFGLDNALQQCIGMFALAIWDRKEQTLSLTRDRMGIKPLYWCYNKQDFIFGSELKALRTHESCPNSINRGAVASYLRHNYVPTPYSIYDNIHKLQPGHIVTYRHGQEPKVRTYWDIDKVVANGQQNQVSGSDNDVIEELHNLLRDAVGCRMMADVKLGAFLSGGIDSSLVVSLMQQASDVPINSFSIGFNEAGYNEAEHAKIIAQHLGTNHTELYVTSDDALNIIPQLAQIYDEPFSDSSQIPTYLVSRMTRNHVTVALSGDGGDELFAGYTRYLTAQHYGAKLFGQPLWLKKLEQAAIHGLSPDAWNRLGAMIPSSLRPSHFGDKLYKLANILTEDRDGFYRNLVSHWPNPNDIVIDGQEYHDILWQDKVKELVPDFISRMQYLDMCTYLPDDILTKVDRASMAVSLEARVPLIDHRVVEYSWRLPNHYKIQHGQGKWILRQILYQYIPKHLIERPKMGFGVPIDAWLRGPLREWAEHLLSPHTFKRHQLLHRAPIIEKWHEHLAGTRNWQYHLWDVLMLHAWADEYGE